MIPKLATNLLHLNVQRAAAAVQNGALRSLQTTHHGGSLNWAGAGSSSSGWGSTGGAKYSGKIYQGYTGAGRAITHANAGPDETEDARMMSLQRRGITPRRGRAASLAPSSADMRMLKHFIARSQRPDGSRQNSTVARELPPELDLAAQDVDIPPIRTGLRKRSKSLSALPEMHARATRQEVEGEGEGVDANMRDYDSWSILHNSEDAAQIRAEIHRVRTQVYPFDLENQEKPQGKGKAPIRRAPQPSTAWFNGALNALYRTRIPGQPVTDVVRLYNDMLARGVLPDANTYAIVIAVLCERDWEVVRALQALDTERIRASITVDADLNPPVLPLSSSEILTSPALQEALPHHAETIRLLRGEIHLPAALALFHAAAIFRGFARNLPFATFARLLRACAARGERGGAVRVWEVLEKRDTPHGPSKAHYVPAVFRHLIATYTSARDVGGAEEVFTEWIKAASKGEVMGVSAGLNLLGSSSRASSDDTESEEAAIMASSGGERDVWDEMVVAYAVCGQGARAVELVERMIDGRDGAPKPTGATFSRMIKAFCDSGDVGTAYAWFERLRAMGGAYTPNLFAWAHIITALGTGGYVREMNALVSSLVGDVSPTAYKVRHAQARVIVDANMVTIERGAARFRAARSSPSNAAQSAPSNSKRPNHAADMAVTEPERQAILASESVEFLFETILPHLPALSHGHQSGILRELAQRLVGPGTIGVVSDDRAVNLVVDRAQAEVAAVKVAATGVFGDQPQQSVSYHPNQPEDVMAITSRAAGAAVHELLTALYAARRLELGQHVRLAKAWCEVTAGVPHHLPARGIVDTLSGSQIELSEEDWKLIADAFATSLLNEVPVSDAALAALSKGPVHAMNWKDVARGAVHVLGPERARAAMAEMGPEVVAFIDSLVTPSPVETGSVVGSPETGFTSAEEETAYPRPAYSPQEQYPPLQPYHIDPLQSKFIDEYSLPRATVTPLDAFARFQAGMHIGRLPAPETIGRLINALGRLGAVDKVQFLYSAAQHALSCLENEKAWQAQAWFQIEDQMVIALAHAERPEAAAIHKSRIIAQGGSPSADAYGALIAGIKNTTDDAHVARELFEEARKLGVPANIFLYNTVISKAARARKAEYALELFHEMRAAGLRPTSVTYGAIIGACCRVGDAETASYLFAEMSSMPNFKPRVPPYNTMMQFFVHTKPNRERCLDYYQAMLDARVRPSSHTYKLLLDCYGTIEPVDLNSMEDVFKRLQQDRSVSVQGAHWAALINAYGCAAHDLDRALAKFDNIPAHAQPDAVAYEALFNVIVMHHRVDLVPQYLERMNNAGVHMTAYIANLLIKGYATAGHLERARGVFDSMIDPPVGLAAVHNHPGHSGQDGIKHDVPVPVGAPVYREPSTWEAMVRAELGAGQKERAVVLLDRMEDRRVDLSLMSENRQLTASWATTARLLSHNLHRPLKQKFFDNFSLTSFRALKISSDV
ncbi:Pentacotripeptide-repeat region of PRORP [Rhizoctonia solani]|uniref:Pentacotripeptide-repeat region of PRORP n=1 Tax=Rhizoctonia solani TaxID=456999 RepID=A0A8H7LIR6_9AGAM|nr:Pentacotripeptide-repeat region of PRORP [Rhizoctonia solani]